MTLSIDDEFRAQQQIIKAHERARLRDYTPSALLRDYAS